MMKTVIPKETQKNETRVSGTPETVRKLTSLGLSVFVERGAGEKAFFSDADYEAAGATLEKGEALFKGADLVLTVNGVSDETLGSLSPSAVVIGLLGAADAASRFPSPLRAFSLELLPRISRAQAMDVLSSQSTVSGYWAVIEASRHLPFLFPLLMTAAGTSAPARVLVLGAGVAGLQAIATAKRLGAVVFALDVRAAAKEQVESLGAQFVVVPPESEVDDQSGYAREMGRDYQVRQAEKLKNLLPSIDCVIGTALIPGKKAPQIIDEEMVSLLKPGSVIVDLAAGSGGNCALTEGSTTFTTKKGVTIVGEANAPSRYPQDASALYARNVLNFVKLLVSEEGTLKETSSDPLLEATCLGTLSV